MPEAPPSESKVPWFQRERRKLLFLAGACWGLGSILLVSSNSASDQAILAFSVVTLVVLLLGGRKLASSVSLGLEGRAEVLESQRRLEEAKERLDLAVRGSTVGLWDWSDTSKPEIWCASRFWELLDFDDHPNETTLEEFGSLLHPDDVERVFAAVDAHVERGEPYNIEYRLRTRGGEYRWFLARGDSKRDPTGRSTRMAGSITDITGRIMVEEENATLALVAARTSNAVVLTSPDRKIEWVNEGFSRLTGYALEDVIGKSPGAVLQRGTADPETVRHMRDRLENGQGFDVELTNYRKDGRSYEVSVEVRPIYDDDGCLLHFMGVETDITERKLNERAIHEANAMKQAVLDAASEVAIIATGIDGTITLFNRGAQCMLGYSEEEVVGIHTPALIHLESEVRERAVELTDQLGREIQGFETFVALPTMGTNEQREWTYVRKDGTRLTVNLAVSAIKDRAGRLLGYLGLAIDVTERIRALKALEHREELLRETGTMARVGAWELDLLTRELYWSDVVKEIHEVDVFYEPAVDAAVSFYPGDAKREIQAAIAAAIEERKPWDLELPFRTAKNSSRVVRVIGAAEFRDGEAVRLKGTFQDVTERKEAENQLQRYVFDLEESRRQIEHQASKLVVQTEELGDARDRAEAASQAKSQFLATMSHEIRTPMNGVIGMTQILMDTELDEQQLEYVTTVKQSGEALLTIINDILDFSKIEAGKMEIEAVPFDMLGAVSEVAELLNRSAEQKGIPLVVDYPLTQQRRVVGDAGRVRQILMNLVGNAIKFTGDGQVGVAVVARPNDSGSTAFTITVEDTGIGISQEGQKVLFGSFSQADASTTRRFGGTGLGLAISRRLVELMDGTIRLESEEGVGTKAIVSLELPTMEEDRYEYPPAIRGKTIAIVDSNERVREAIASELRSARMVVTTASDLDGLVLEGVSRESGLDFLILDLVPFSATPTEIVATVEGRFDTGRPRLLALTRAEGASERARLVESGFSETFLKPARLHSIVDLLAELADPASSERVQRKQVESGSIESESSAPESSRAAARVLLAEDNIVNQKVATKMIEKFGGVVDVAANGREAVEMWAQLPYDIILMDCQMPELDGYEATREIRRREAGTGRTIPIVAMTANAMPGDRERCLESGMDDFVSKPVSSSELESKLEQYASATASLRSPSMTIVDRIAERHREAS